MANFPTKLKVFVHALGLGSLGSALFLQTTVFTSIFRNGYFRGIEGNQTVLTLEIGLTAFAIAYLGYMVFRFVDSSI